MEVEMVEEMEMEVEVGVEVEMKRGVASQPKP